MSVPDPLPGNGSTRERGAAEKVAQTFRMPRELVEFHRVEAAQSGRDLTGQVLRVLEGFRSFFGLPEAAVAQLEADRRRLGMDRFAYLLHVLYSRALEIRAKGVGFDAPGDHRNGANGAGQAGVG
jgi:hypothetical protein